MKLIKLIATGFKSFADKTEFEFGDGISCIVGPNGCGKSNVVDAIKWVLGEQSAKSLRGSEMMDVIFNGSSSRRASGHAEVILVFDNSSGLLRPDLGDDDKPATTVSIARRLFRSGQSEYLINKQQVRLRDIREMFMDTGIGARAYSVIEQGQVELFLQASHEERRAIFDEAAGISKYKARKKEALRKLERVEQNLLRLADVVGEVQRRLRSIKYQAGKARNYQTYTQQLNEKKSLYYLSQYHILSGQRVALQKRLDHNTDVSTGIGTRVDHLNAALASTEAEIEDLERNARDLRVQIATTDGQITTWQERSDAHAARVQELGRHAAAMAQRCESFEAKVVEFDRDIAQRQSEQDSVSQRLEELDANYTELHAAQQAGEMKMSRMEADLADEKNGTMDLIRRTAHFHNEIKTHSIRQDTLKGRRERLKGRAGEVAQAVEALLTERAQVQAKLTDVQETLSATKVRLEEVTASSRSLADGEHQLRQELSQVREERSALASRSQALREMQQRREGLGAGVKAVLEAKASGALSCINGMLGDFIRADVADTPIIEAALGGADQQLVADSFQDLADSRQELAQIVGENSAVEIWCLDSLGPWKDDFDAASVKGVAGRAVDRVRFDSWLGPIMWRLLGKTLIVETLADARAAMRLTPPNYRFVTARGEVLEPDGRVRLGWANRAAGVVTRHSELDELVGRIEDMDRRVGEIEGQCQAAVGQRQHMEKVLQGLRTAVYEDSMELTGCSSRLEQLDRQTDALKQEEPLIADDLSHVAEEISAAVQAEYEAKEKSAELEEVSRQRQEQVKALEQQIAEGRKQQAVLVAQITEVKVELGQAREKAYALKESLAGLRRQRDQMARDIESSRAEVATCRDRCNEAQQAIAKAKEEIETLYARHETLSRDVEDIDESRTGLKQKLNDIRTDLTAQRKAMEEAEAHVNACRVDLGKLDANISNLISRASEDMDMDLIGQFNGYEHDEGRNWDTVSQEIKELDEKIKRLGNVNLDAIAEQEELDGRNALYEGQVKDVEESRRKLSDLIKRINKESRDLFSQTFAEVRENFQELFRKLFGGGRADILLTDPQDVLESGIDIIARPPGKETRNLSLLSGGEKTMTALALLFSIFKSKPSPFCLLDEVDAALDEANTERFARLIMEFVGTSQFIVISHAKRTMSMANVLYGITMQEAGVSKRISVRFEEAHKHAESTPEPVGA